PPICIEALRNRQKQELEEAATAGRDWKENALVFPSSLGTPMEPDNLRRSWERIKLAAGVDLRFHDLRHTCVSLLLSIGTPPHIVREIAGHSDLKVTMGIYAHTSLEEKYDALKRLGEQLKGAAERSNEERLVSGWCQEELENPDPEEN
ncbi:MAG: tyrosine-type recombinase/integrase, partial [Longispora sp.]|nr:tyrosine-type recombinase/integrase [Longispora sp. (in: high G+C Gram-positive bacteria)]